MIGNADDETNFQHEFLLTNRQVANLRKAFVIFSNNSSSNIKLSKTQLSKMIQWGGFLGRLLGPLLKTGLPLTKNVIKPLAKSVLILLGLAAAASETDAGIPKKTWSSEITTLTTSNDEMEDSIRIVKPLEDSGLLLKGVSETIQSEAKEQKGGFLSMLLGTLGASLSGNMLVGKGINKAGYGSKDLQSKEGFLIPPHPLTNFDIQKYYRNEPRFNGVYSRNNLPNKIKDGAYIINLDEYSDNGTHLIVLYAFNNIVIYFDSFGIEHIPKEI